MARLRRPIVKSQHVCDIQGETTRQSYIYFGNIFLISLRKFRKICELVSIDFEIQLDNWKYLLMFTWDHRACVAGQGAGVLQTLSETLRSNSNFFNNNHTSIMTMTICPLKRNTQHTLRSYVYLYDVPVIV